MREDGRYARSPFEAVVSFAAEFYEFRFAELDAVAAMLDVEVTYDRELDIRDGPYVAVTFANLESALAVAARCVGVRGVYELWGSAQTMDELEGVWAEAVAAARADESHPGHVWFGEGVGYCFRMDSYGRTRSHTEMLEIYKGFMLPGFFDGKVKLKKPDAAFWIFENWGRRLSNQIPETTQNVWIGRKVAGADGRAKVAEFDLKKRAYLGTTSMNAELALLMANQVHARPGSLVFDPYVGTGSLLVPAAGFGASVMGADMCGRTMRGEVNRYADRDVVQRDIWANVIQYDLHAEWVDVFRQDMAHPALRMQPLFDGIVADPPYGIREGAKKIGARKPGKVLPDQSKFSTSHIPQRIPYNGKDIFADLLNFAARTLVIGGRLCFWMATTVDYEESHVPSHPALVVVANSEQYLTYQFRRRLITMIKVEHCTPDMTAFVPDVHDDNLTGSIREKACLSVTPKDPIERREVRKRRRANNQSRGTKRLKHNPVVDNQLEVQRRARARALQRLELENDDIEEEEDVGPSNTSNTCNTCSTMQE